MTRRGERGQALVETALAAPLLVLLTLGLLQMGWLLWQRVRLESSAMAAARAFTAWEPDGTEVALSKARRAAWLALRPQPRGSALHLQAAPPAAYTADEKANHQTWLRSGLGHSLELELQLPPPWGLAWLWPNGLKLRTPILILSEHSRERLESPR